MPGQKRVEAGDPGAACSRAAESAANRSNIPGAARIGSPRRRVPTDCDSAVIGAAGGAKRPRNAVEGDHGTAPESAGRPSQKQRDSRGLAGVECQVSATTA